VTALPQDLAERPKKCGSRVLIVNREEFKVLQFCSRLSLHVDRPLKRDVVVRAHAGVSRESRINRLEVHEEEGMGERTEFLLQPLSEPGAVILHRIAGPPLPRGQRIIRRDVVDGADSQLDEFSHLERFHGKHRGVGFCFATS